MGRGTLQGVTRAADFVVNHTPDKGEKTPVQPAECAARGAVKAVFRVCGEDAGGRAGASLLLLRDLRSSSTLMMTDPDPLTAFCHGAMDTKSTHNTHTHKKQH